jgi:hypothetical protein
MSTHSEDVTARDRLGEKSDRAKETAADIGAQARSIGERARAEARTRVEGAAQDARAEGGRRLHGVADALDKAADDSDDAMLAAPLMRRAAGMARDASHRLEDASLSETMAAVRDSARRNPALFLGAAFAAGFAVSRFASADERRGRADYDRWDDEDDAAFAATPRNSPPTAPMTPSDPLAPADPLSAPGAASGAAPRDPVPGGAGASGAGATATPGAPIGPASPSPMTARPASPSASPAPVKPLGDR